MKRLAGWLPLLAVFSGIVAMALTLRPLLPIDETRYVSVAWEMWLRQDFLVPFKNGATYSHKPPLLFWLIQGGWAIFGVNDWWPRLVHPLMGLASLILAAVIGRRLWPRLPGAAQTAPYLLLGSLWWAVFTTTSMFDMLVVFFVEVGVLGLILAASRRPFLGWFLVALGIGLGILTKGPVVLLFLLPLMLLGPLIWRRQIHIGRWTVGGLLSFIGGVGIALCWAIPAGQSGGEAYQNAIFWGQTAGRVSDSFAHARPFYWYFMLLPGLLFPWFFWPEAWKAVQGPRREAAVRLCWAWALIPLVIFSFVSGKQPHYLLPMFPALALLVGRGLAVRGRAESVRVQLPGVFLAGLGAFLVVIVLKTEWSPWPEVTPELSPLWGGALLSGGLALLFFGSPRREFSVQRLFLAGPLIVVVAHGAGFGPLANSYNMAPTAQAIGALQAKGVKVAHLGEYHAEYHFVGRLEQPLVIHESYEALKTWVVSHPHAWVLLRKDHHENKKFWTADVLQTAKPLRPYRTTETVLVPVSSL
jgi:4-amino-4-deoxy-L-arabinose transferase-like glycosyltransferase